jgi:drug/metabolite transporter (DMT)-like permease
VLLIVAAVFCFALLDATVKHLTQRYSVTLLVWSRYGVQALAMLLWLGPTMRGGLVRSRHLPMQLARGAILLASSLCFVSALKELPLAEATALNYMTPVLVVVLSVLVLHERLTRWRIFLIVAGVVGMLLIVRPGFGVFQSATLWVLGAAAFFATFQILTRKLAGDDIRVTLFFPALVGTALMSVGLPWLVPPPSIPAMDVAMIVGAGLCGTVGHFLFIRAFQRAPASALTPFTYLQLVWATLIGWVVFGHFPEAHSLAGMAVITGGGLVVALRERQRPWVAVDEPTAVD